MDVPEPPTIVLEQPAPCADAQKAEVLLKRALAPSLAPHAAWSVKMRVTRANGTLTAEGEITDETNGLVAHRSIAKESAKTGGECSALARAMGVWASLVLDAEVERSKLPTPVPPAPLPPPVVEAVRLQPFPVDEERGPDRLFLRNPENKRSFELGVGGLYMDGLLGSSGPPIVGVNAFSIFEVGSGLFLRPTLGLGRSTGSFASGSIFATWGAARFDACGRMPGNYLERKGIQIDVCGGADLGFLSFDSPSQVVYTATPTTLPSAVPLFAPGTSIAMRGELGNQLAAELRGLVGMNVVREHYDNDIAPRLLYARLELGLSWRIR